LAEPFPSLPLMGHISDVTALTMSVHRRIKGKSREWPRFCSNRVAAAFSCRPVGPHWTVFLLQQPFAGRSDWPCQNFDLAVVHVLDDLGEIAHIEPLRSDRAFCKVISLALSDAVAISTGVAGKFSAHVHHRLPSADFARYSTSASNDGSTQMPRCAIFLA
jgi:hypothetical protein